MSTRLVAALILYFIWNCGACADPAMREQIMQKGQFAKPDCTPDAQDPDYNSCMCDADVRYPQLSKLDNPVVENKFNDWFKEQAATTVCEGNIVTPTPATAKDERGKAHSSISVHYETTLLSPPIIAFKFTDWAYTGGAHGNGTVIGVILDTKSGKFLTPTDIFSEKNMAAVNKQIYDVLSSKPEEEIFRDQIEARHRKFIKNGVCDGCTLILTPQGVHVLFQTYEVAPYGAGNTDVPIAAKYITNTSVAKAIE